MRIPGCGSIARSLTAALLCAVLSPPLHAAAPMRGLQIKLRDEQGREFGPYAESYALLVGAGEYTGGWPRLPGVGGDLEAVRAALEAHGFKVETLADPTRERLLAAMDDFIRRRGMAPGNRLVFYFAGHGHTVRKSYGEEMGYFVPVDAPNPERDREGFLAKAVDMQLVEVYAKRIEAKHALFVFDSCFSGSLFAISRAVPESISYRTARPVRQFITSGSADEQVPDRSVFREQFVTGLAGDADLNRDGYVTGTELGEFLQDAVINYSRGSQHPQYGKIRNPNLDKGDLIFEVARAAVPEPPAAPSPSGAVPMEDLEDTARRHEQTRAAWDERLKRMQEDFARLQEFGRRDVPPDLAREGWRRFLEVFAEDNPYTEEDDRMRADARARLQAERAPEPPPPAPQPPPAAPPSAGGPHIWDLMARESGAIARVTVRRGRASVQGIGVVVDQAGNILANKSLLEGGGDVVVAHGGQEHPAPVRGLDAATDAGLLGGQRRESGSQAVRFGDAGSVRVGDTLLWIREAPPPGVPPPNPIILRVRSLGELLELEPAGGPGGTVENGTTVAGFVFNREGAVVGMVTGAPALRAVPANTLRQVASRLAEHGRVTRGWLGVKIQSLTPETRQSLRAPAQGGARVLEVTKGGPADRAGVKVDDVILRFGDQEVHHSEHLTQAVMWTEPGTRIVLRVLRDGREKDLKLKVGKRPE